MEFQRLSTEIRHRVRQHRDEIYHLRSQRTRISAIDNPDGTAALQDRDIAASLAGAFEQYHNTPETDPATEELVEESLRSFYLKSPIFPETALEFLTSPGCIRKHISKSSSLKAPGNDNIQNHVLKHIPRKTLAQITYIFNAAFKLHHFPSPWKTATVIPAPKPGKEPRLATSYRPISLLPAISKIFEKILLRYIDKYTNDNSVLPPEQFGFRRKHSTNHQVARVVTDVISAFNKRQHTALMVVDMEKAFDRVWVEGLIHKLILN
ncbi:hypothetical protein Trydic_g1807 [Trypoxylus dichotomus]